MASKKDLMVDIVKLSEALSLDVEVSEEGSHRDLSDVLSDLKAKTRDAELSTAADKPPVDEEKADKAKTPEDKPPVDEPPVDEPKQKADADAGPVYLVSKGKSVTSKKGVRDGGDTIKPEWLGGGQKALNALVKAGNVERK